MTTEVPRRKVVVVEDDAATRKLIQRQLESAGYEVIARGDGRAALEPITALSRCIVLADWSMPEMDGLELCRTVRQLEEMQAVANIYFILLTAHDSKKQIVAGLKAGANDYLTKPYHPGELLARIHVGERMLRLQEELLQRTMEFQKANTQLALLTRKLEELARTDGLTGLANRRYLVERLEEIWALAERRSLPLSCVVLDVDRFKRINDTYGHAVGDHVLRDIAETLRETSRQPDLCGRFGGEEFVIVCPATPLDGAAALAERIRRNVAARVVVHDGQTITVSISCGVAQRDARTLSPEELIRNADAMLYAAKQHGRNQTWVFDEDPRGRRIESSAPVT